METLAEQRDRADVDAVVELFDLGPPFGAERRSQRFEVGVEPLGVVAGVAKLLQVAQHTLSLVGGGAKLASQTLGFGALAGARAEREHRRQKLFKLGSQIPFPGTRAGAHDERKPGQRVEALLY